MQLSAIGNLPSLFGKSPLLPTFQILSDLHLEVSSQYYTFDIPPSAPYLILAGDIGRLIDYDAYLAFLAKQTTQFEKVFLVLGNHEFYDLSFPAALKEAQRLEKEAILNGKLVLCHQKHSVIEIENSQIIVLGCTLWSKINDDARDAVQGRIKDFKNIDSWSIDDHNAAHTADLEWLSSQVASIQTQNKSRAMGEPERRILIITHHAPSLEGTSSPKNANNPWGSAFATDILGDSDLNWQDVKVWVFGHTHFTTDFGKNGIRVLSNQRGYVLPGGSEEKYEKDAKVEFDPKKVFYV
ncbi:hypothetical protein EYC80_010579 [Monilinia laxa]|uniref:Calcineurin-like phosphoesterase domain-containing protein n=1 Tax=Monilinia laxa TaxID=61186 RepID=A0A5N6JQT7_MONLA|nr:hypothetical protein EYC80_010579 [Monilinia laxa]